MPPRLPNPEEWEAIQGGEPTILQSPTGRILEVIHNYAKGVMSDGTVAIVQTPIDQLLGTQLLHFAHKELSTSGTDDIVVPAALLFKMHGAPCEDRSEEGYTRIPLDKIDEYIANKEQKGWKRKTWNLK